MKKQKEGKGEWKDELASDSESIVSFLDGLGSAMLTTMGVDR